MAQGRAHRILAGAFFPPLVGWVLFLLIGSFYSTQMDSDGSVFPDAYFLLFFAYFYVFIPALIFSLFMEFLVAKWVKSDLLGVVIGGCCGTVVGLLLGTLWWQIGLLTGILIGWYLRKNLSQTVNKSNQQGPLAGTR